MDVLDAFMLVQHSMELSFPNWFKRGGEIKMDTQQSEFQATIHALRKEIDGLTQKVRAEADKRPARGGAELTLSFRSLQLAKMWLGKVLEEDGSQLPAQFADKA